MPTTPTRPPTPTNISSRLNDAIFIREATNIPMAIPIPISIAFTFTALTLSTSILLYIFIAIINDVIRATMTPAEANNLSVGILDITHIAPAKANIDNDRVINTLAFKVV